MTPAQLATLKTAITANQTWAALPLTSGGALVIAEGLNAKASPDYIVWKTDVSIDEIMRNGMDWARVDNLSIGKARIWDWLGRLGSFNASKPNVRAGIDAAWVGTTADLAVRAQVYTHCKRTASVVEKLFAVGSGTDVSPSVMGFEGVVSADEVAQARES